MDYGYKVSEITIFQEKINFRNRERERDLFCRL